MAAGPITIREIDYRPSAMASWQTMKSPVTAAETALTAAKLMQNIRDVSADQDTVQFIPVELFESILVMPLANGNNDQSPVLQFYGWSDTGPGHHIGTITLDLGNFTSAASTGFHASANTHSSIRNAFAAATAWRPADILTVTADYELEFLADSLGVVGYHAAFFPYATSTGTQPPVADFPNYLRIDLAKSQYKYCGMLVSALDSATSVGAIFKPSRFRPADKYGL